MHDWIGTALIALGSVLIISRDHETVARARWFRPSAPSVRSSFH